MHISSASLFLFFFLATQGGLQNLSSLTRGSNLGSGSESTESQLLDHQGIPFPNSYNALAQCGRLNDVPQSSGSPEPQSMALFQNRVFADVMVKLRPRDAEKVI